MLAPSASVLVRCLLSPGWRRPVGRVRERLPAGRPWRTDLITASTAGLLAVTVMSATVQLPILPEVNHVDQEFTTGAADKTRRVPELIVASPFSIDGWVSFLHAVFAAVTGLGERSQTTVIRALTSSVPRTGVHRATISTEMTMRT